MKKGTLILIGSLAIVLFTLSYCKDGEKPLFYQEDGNYFVDNNFIVKSTTAMSDEDVNQLISLDTDTNYAKLTKGSAVIIHTAHTLHILQTAHILHLEQIAQLSHYDKLRIINHRVSLDERGANELGPDVWTRFGDLKSRLDAILNKYKPALVNGNVSIRNNQVATAVVELNAADIDQLNKMSVRGVDEINQCGEYMGPNQFTHIVQTVVRVKPDKALTKSLNKILSAYNKK